MLRSVGRVVGAEGAGVLVVGEGLREGLGVPEDPLEDRFAGYRLKGMMIRPRFWVRSHSSISRMVLSLSPGWQIPQRSM